MNNPTDEEAQKKLIVELDKTRSGKFINVTIIHWYGSNGVGRALCPAIRKSLRLLEEGRKYVGFKLP